MKPGECKGDAESKGGDEKETDNGAKGQDYCDGGAVVPCLDLLSVECGPSNCPVEERLGLSMDFTLDRPLNDAIWEIKFVVDSVNERHEIVLGSTESKDYARGACSMRFEVPRISVQGIKPCTLANTGLLVATLKYGSSSLRRRDGECGGARGGEGEGEVAAVNLVVQVTDAGQGRFTRCIYSPLE